MRIVCAWCKVYIGAKEPYADQSNTHGICPVCYAEQGRALTGEPSQSPPEPPAPVGEAPKSGEGPLPPGGLDDGPDMAVKPEMMPPAPAETMPPAPAKTLPKPPTIPYTVEKWVYKAGELASMGFIDHIGPRLVVVRSWPNAVADVVHRVTKEGEEQKGIHTVTAGMETYRVIVGEPEGPKPRPRDVNQEAVSPEATPGMEIPGRENPLGCVAWADRMAFTYFSCRDMFASMVLGEFVRIAHQTGNPREGNETLTKWAAELAYQVADAMIKAREEAREGAKDARG